jgi:hypothetical protein
MARSKRDSNQQTFPGIDRNAERTHETSTSRCKINKNTNSAIKCDRRRATAIEQELKALKQKQRDISIAKYGRKKRSYVVTKQANFQQHQAEETSI